MDVRSGCHEVAFLGRRFPSPALESGLFFGIPCSVFPTALFFPSIPINLICFLTSCFFFLPPIESPPPEFPLANMFPKIEASSNGLPELPDGAFWNKEKPFAGCENLLRPYQRFPRPPENLRSSEIGILLHIQAAGMAM
ncbi:hypothetical protein SLE2022_119830 [Rubroshorea leprosula]